MLLKIEFQTCISKLHFKNACQNCNPTWHFKNAFENVTQGDALYSRASDGQVGKAIANDTLDKAVVAGIAETTVTAGNEVRVIITGQVAVSTSIDPGDLYYLSAASAGSLTKTPPTTAGHYVTLVGEAGTSNQIVLKIKRPIQLR